MDCLAVLDQFLKENQIAFSAEVPMKDYTTFKIGGNCRRMVWPSSGCEIRKLLTFCREKQLPLYLVGNGSNLLDRKSTRLNSSHIPLSRMPSSA